MRGEVPRWMSLEAENYLFRWMSVLALCLLCAFVFFGAFRPCREIAAQKFVLVDEAGTPRATLSTGPQGPVLAFLGRDGRARIVLALSETIAGIALCDSQGMPRMGIALVGDVAGIAFGDPRGILRLGVALTEKDPVIGFYDSQGNLIRQLP